MGQKGNQDPDGTTGVDQDETVDSAKQEKEQEASKKREETKRLIERIVRSTVAAAEIDCACFVCEDLCHHLHRR